MASLGMGTGITRTGTMRTTNRTKGTKMNLTVKVKLKEPSEQQKFEAVAKVVKSRAVEIKTSGYGMILLQGLEIGLQLARDQGYEVYTADC